MLFNLVTFLKDHIQNHYEKIQKEVEKEKDSSTNLDKVTNNKFSNNFGNCLFSNCQIDFNGVNITKNNNELFPIKTYLFNKLFVFKNKSMESLYWIEDETSRKVVNSTTGTKFDLYFKLNEDIFHLDKVLLNYIEIIIRLTKNNPNYTCYDLNGNSNKYQLLMMIFLFISQE